MVMLTCSIMVHTCIQNIDEEGGRVKGFRKCRTALIYHCCI